MGLWGKVFATGRGCAIGAPYLHGHRGLGIHDGGWIAVVGLLPLTMRPKYTEDEALQLTGLRLYRTE